MTVIQAVLLGVLQGITEFLPVSSSGHLVLAQELLNIPHEGDMFFEVFVHFGTLLSVLVAFRKEVWAILLALGALLKRPRDFMLLYNTNEYLRLGVFIVIGSIPSALIGLNYEHQIENLFADPKLIAVMLMVTGFIIFLTRFVDPTERAPVGLISSIIIGCAQAVAIIPGISRSGSTISTALFSGVSRENSAKFSFLLAVPVIFGATLLETKALISSPPSVHKLLTLGVGTAVAAISGYFAIMILLDILRKRRFSWFSYYCFVVGILGVLFIG